MILTEYDEKKHLKNVYRDGYDDGNAMGYINGREEGLVEERERIISILLSRGKTVEEIAALLDLPIEDIFDKNNPR